MELFPTRQKWVLLGPWVWVQSVIEPGRDTPEVQWEGLAGPLKGYPDLRF